ncbi:surface-adhesin E family protein [Caulobacter sp. 17J80-11]|uniref:surface-adhesin E family protein n=1 Tax=Caulobacter sp. 17J80-11 TaxID=2763502 RepID=UPI00165347FD|nr:surface-adhesin E family protein [Caulobacter sp. 17J80-11]MBC6981942.1 hypothetical protein [Caulobacter sp. 17J80-11]
MKTELQASGTALALVVTGLIGCAPAEAEPTGSEPNRDWVSVVDQDGFRVHVDRRSLKRDGMRVRSEIRVANDEPGRTPKSRAYVDAIHFRVDDCATGAFTTELFVYRTADGAVVEEDRRKDPRPISNDPGTVAARVTASICELAGLPAPLVASIPLSGLKPADWHVLGIDPKGGFTVSVMPASAHQLDDGVATIVARIELPSPWKLPDGRPFKSIVNKLYFTCAGKAYGIETSDYYGLSGELLQADLLDVMKSARTVEAGTLTDSARQIACAAPARTS